MSKNRQPKLNVELLEEVYDHIESHPEEWDQGTWGTKTPCNTTMCFAGTTVALKGFKLLFEGAHERYLEAVNCKKPRGKVWDISQKAQELLGLNMTEREMLFLETSTDIDDLRDTVNAIEAGYYR